MIVGDFVNNLSKYWASHCVSSDLICVDKSMSTWYRLGRHCINMGLPMHMAIDCKPVDGCEIQNLCDSRSQVMIHMKLVKLDADKDRYMMEIISGAAHQRRIVHLLHGTKVLIDLVNP